MERSPAGSLLACLAQILDPRGRQGRRHSLEAMLASIVCAWLQVARGYEAVAEWLHDQDVGLWQASGFTRRPPKKGVFRNLLMAIAPEHFEQAVRTWIASWLDVPPLEQPLAAVAIDGKSFAAR